MKKLWYLLLAVCTVGAFAACSDDEDNTADTTTPDPVSPITECVVPATAEIGGTLAVAGKGFDATSKLYLRDEAGKDTFLENETLTETGIECTVPSTLAPATYTVMLQQNGDWTLGTVRLEEMPMPVTGYSVPATATLGEKLEITGAGFDETSKIVLVAADGARTELNTSLTSAGVECELPADLAAGDYGVILVQKNRDWTLAEKISLVARKRLTALGCFMSMEGMDEPWPTVNYGFKYDEAGNLSAIQLTGDGMALDLYTVATTDSQVEGKVLPEMVDYLNDNQPDEFLWTLDGSRIASSSSLFVKRRLEYDWTYNEAGYCTAIGKDIFFEYDQNGNCVKINWGDPVTFGYEAEPQRNGTYGVDVVKAFMFTQDMDADWAYAYVAGYAGNVSLALPVTINEEPIVYEFADGYVTSATFPFSAMGISFTVQFTYE